MSFAIEKNVEMPSWYRTNGGAYQGMYPFESMDIGDSFLVPCAPLLQGKIQASLANAFNSFILRHKKDWHFRTRRCTGGVRLWRTETSYRPTRRD